jgi:hypothetical protein
MSVWDGDDEDLKQLLKDMGFRENDQIPYWIYDLATDLIDSGWRKKP